MSMMSPNWEDASNKNDNVINKKSNFELTPVQSTSLLTAYWRYMESHQSVHQPLIDDPTSKTLVDALLCQSLRADYDASPIRPYGIDCLAVRTRAMDDWLVAQKNSQPEESKEVQKRQLVNLGAGMCGRPYRMKDVPNIYQTWWEVDSDLDLLRTKRSVLSAAGYESRVPIHDLCIDLARQSLHDTLTAQPGFVSNDENIRTDWIAEGLFAYLEPHRHLSLLQETAFLSTKGSRMTVTVAEPAMMEFWGSFGAKIPHQVLVPVNDILTKARDADWMVDQHIRPQEWSQRYPGRGEHLPGYHVLFLEKK